MQGTSTLRMTPEPGEERRPSGAISADFQRIFLQEFEYVCRALRRLGVHERDLKDVTQELFLVVHSRLHLYDPSRPIKSWLFAFAVRFASNYRQLARHQETEDDTSAEHSHEAALEAKDLVLRSLAALPFDRRTAIVMHDFEGFDAPEIALQLGIPVNTVYSRIRLGREDFRNAIVRLQKGGDA
jgi:RNA polymerase sigma-70 factor, ECF subfamily